MAATPFAYGFFVFTDEGPGREVASWFIAAEARHPLICAWDEAIARHLARTTTPHEAYFHTFYVFQHAIKSDLRLRSALAIMPRLPAPPCFLLASFLTGTISGEKVKDAISGGLPLSKLDWRLPLTGDELRARIEAVSGTADPLSCEGKRSVG